MLTSIKRFAHVWTQLEMLELMIALRRSPISFDFECFCAYGIEGTFVLRKGALEGSDIAEESLQQARVEMAELIQSMRPNGK